MCAWTSCTLLTKLGNLLPAADLSVKSWKFPMKWISETFTVSSLGTYSLCKSLDAHTQSLMLKLLLSDLHLDLPATQVCYLGNTSSTSEPAAAAMAKGDGQGEGSGKGGPPGIVYSILWFLGVIFLAWPGAFLFSWLYVLLLPFGACIEPLKGLLECFLKKVQRPLEWTENMLNAKPCPCCE